MTNMTYRDLTHFWAPVVSLFQLYALTPLTKPTMLILCYNILVSISLGLVISYTWLVQIPSTDEFNLNAVMDIALIVVIQLSHVVVISEIYIRGSIQSEVLPSINRIFRFFDEQLNSPINLIMLRRFCVRKCWSLYAIVAVLMLFGASLYFDVFWEYWGPSYFSWQLMAIRKIQICFYVDLLTEILKGLRTVLTTLRDLESHHHYRLLIILRIKRVYAEIQKTSAVVSHVFAWSLIFILLENIVDLLNNIYWLIINVYYTKSGIHVASEYILSRKCCFVGPYYFNLFIFYSINRLDELHNSGAGDIVFSDRIVLPL